MTQSIQSSPGLERESFPPVEEILPHRGTMLLLDAVLACADESLTAQARVQSDAWYADAQGAMPAWIGIELMAQAIAAHVGLLEMRAGNSMRPGVLLGSRRYEMHTPAFAPDALLRIEVKELLRGDEGHGAYECVIQHDDVVAAEAVIKVFRPRDFQSFIEEGFRS
ncbi:hotdog family protein [Paraburkholderia phenazinium]|jgi:predicted hotdog family 3-hydroxylacyl-ACP dehydratase|uniref:Predicted 3-hydroxylacyl-ACP dehydratase, HotDog domain n=1 Tax=Paraburkholderia phenazinium TaxID=60549 RepID=A0A1G7Q6S6_9BURK|nr:hotdog family protein [Paraburkholderia phenazinium]SDF94173.1 Predicted 3-hydroxylacyl-ACP dehydratase, HotDog domain [Paraburkholderia phenazinium]